MKYIYIFLSLIYKVFNFSARKYKILTAVSDGMIVGDKTKFVGEVEFGTEPYLIKIGSCCTITNGVKFINHDGGIQVGYIKKGIDIDDVYGKKVVLGKIEVGDNVFIGVNSILLPGTKVGSNVVIGAGSVLKGCYPSDVILAGVPARILGRVDDYHQKNEINHINIYSSDKRERKNIILGRK